MDFSGIFSDLIRFGYYLDSLIALMYLSSNASNKYSVVKSASPYLLYFTYTEILNIKVVEFQLNF